MLVGRTTEWVAHPPGGCLGAFCFAGMSALTNRTLASHAPAVTNPSRKQRSRRLSRRGRVEPPPRRIMPRERRTTKARMEETRFPTNCLVQSPGIETVLAMAQANKVGVEGEGADMAGARAAVRATMAVANPATHKATRMRALTLTMARWSPKWQGRSWRRTRS